MKSKLIPIFLSLVLLLGVCTGASAEEERYVHGEEGYLNIADELPDFKMRSQDAGDCWVYSAAAGMETAFARKSGYYITVDPREVLNTCYAKENAKEEGFVLPIWVSINNIGGWEWIVTESLSNGFGEHLVLDSAVIIDNKDRDTIKEIIQTRGGISAGVLDNDAKQGFHQKYFTMNDTKGTWFDHEITIIGWDDHFPKEYFNEPATEDGAWICYNSNTTLKGYYYMSYCTPIDNMISFSMTDRYVAVEAYDAGNEQDKYIQTGDATTVANVFHRAGTLAALGTYNDFDCQEITINVYEGTFNDGTFNGDPVYTQNAVLDYHGYHTVELDTPVEVTDCVVAITYSKGAPVEGETIDYDPVIYRTVSAAGQSYVRLETTINASGTGELYTPVDSWYDLTDDGVADTLGLDFKPGNCCIKALYTE